MFTQMIDFEVVSTVKQAVPIVNLRKTCSKSNIILDKSMTIKSIDISTYVLTEPIKNTITCVDI